MKSTSGMSQNRFLGGISTSSVRNLLPRSISAKQKSNPDAKSLNSNNENAPPVDPNILVEKRQCQFAKPSVLKSFASRSKTPRLESRDEELQSTATLTTKGNTRPDVDAEVAETLDPPVKVVVRIRPANGDNRAVRKISSDSLLVGDRKFTFDSILDSSSNQQDIFQLVGVPLVENALAGYNTSILSYGQTGSGKTYTMWGPPSAMLEDPSPGGQQGIAPRIFQLLFSEIQRVQDSSEGKQKNYQCRCSFLEIYNDQIGDLLDPTQRNLEIKDEQKNGMYVENLTEEYVNTYEEVAQILMKGLSSRKLGATSLNSRSSRSHIVFTFVIESWHKETSSKCYSTTRTSRISLVDLAGAERNKLDDAGRQHAKEEKFLKKSVSHLGRVTKVLTAGVHQQMSEDVIFKGSCLTHLLRESLGGNSKLTVICAISPDNKNASEIMSTLRFGQRVKSIRNKPVINEISEEDVNDLSDQIRQLKEELIRAKTSVGSRNEHVKGRSMRESLNHLRVSLNRSLILPHIDNDDEDVTTANEDDVRELHQQLKKLYSSCDDNQAGLLNNRDSVQSSFVSASSEPDLLSEDEICSQETEVYGVDSEKLQKKNIENDVVAVHSRDSIPSMPSDPAPRSGISIIPCQQPPFLQEPILSESPKIRNSQRKSVSVSSSCLATENLARCSNSESLRQSKNIHSSLRSSKIFPGPTELLAASLQRGLQVLDYHQRNSTSNKSSVSFSFDHFAMKPCDGDKKQPADESVSTLFCPSCHQKYERILNESTNGMETHSAAVDGDTNQVAKGADANISKNAREKELENMCMEQAAKIELLSQQLEKYELGKENQIIPHKEPRNEELSAEKNKLLICNDVKDHRPEVMKETTHEREYGKTRFDINEKEELLKEIEDLKSKLQTRACASPRMSTEKLRSSLLSRSFKLRKSMDCRKDTQEELELEQERQRWMEMESDWILLTDELRVDIETERGRADQLENELKSEKNCTEELGDALNRAILGHARFVEHYTELQEKYNDLDAKHRAIMQGVAEIKRAAAKAGSKCRSSRFAKSLAAELSALRVEREKERDFLKKENNSLKIQLRETAEAVHAAGELLVRLREAERVASAAEENSTKTGEENEKLKKQVEKLKRKHKMEMVTMKQCIAESKLPESALRQLYREDSDVGHNSNNIHDDDDQAWRAEFGAIYQNHY